MSNFRRNPYPVGLQRILRRGLRVTIIPLWDCNFSCEYCCRKDDGSFPTGDVKSLDQWKRFITDLNGTFKRDRLKIKEIILTGGEPTLLPYFKQLCDWILDQGFILVVYTNLSNTKKLKSIRKSFRLRIHTTHHPGFFSEAKFNKNLLDVMSVHNVVVDEIGERRLSSCPIKTKLKPYGSDEQIRWGLSSLRVEPDFAINIYCIPLQMINNETN